MPHVHYKFSSKLNSDTVVFDGPHLTLTELKRLIMGREKLRSGDCDLQITNAQTKEEYTEDEETIPGGSSVIVKRIPIIGVKSGSNSKTRNFERADVHHYSSFGAMKAMDEQGSSRALPLFSKMINLAEADMSEEDKIKALINQSIYDPLSYKKCGTTLPANYTCYRCGNAGHHIRNCPASGGRGADKNFEAPLRLKKSTGIPRSFMVEVDDPNIKGAMLTNCGHFAIPAIHVTAYAMGKKERPPFVPQEAPSIEEPEDPVPDELLCLICHDLMSDAVVIPCCGNSYCDDCIRSTLLDSEDHICPTCSQSDVSPDTLIANKFLRQAVNTFKKEQGQSKGVAGRHGTAQPNPNPAQTPCPVPTPSPLAVQSQPQKPPQLSQSQQGPLLLCSQASDMPTSPQVCGAPTATDPAPASIALSTSLLPGQTPPEITDKEAEEKTSDGSVAAAPSVLVSHKDPPPAASLMTPVQLSHTPAAEQHQAVGLDPQLSSSGTAPGLPVPSSSCWDSPSSSSACPSGGWKESNTQQLPPSSSSSSYPAGPPPLFPSPHFLPFLAAQQPLNTYPPGYPPATPVWPPQNPQSAPIPSLCSSSSASPIPTLISKDWSMHQRKKSERSPHKSKGSRSYSRSSSRSRSRSRSKGRSKPRSPYSRHRHLRTRSHFSQYYSYGYKRSPSPSSSSSSRVGYCSRSKSPSDHRKNRYHSRHHRKKSAPGRSSSRTPRESAKHEDKRLARFLYAQHIENSSQEPDKQSYHLWKQQCIAWYDEYLSSYVGQFQQPPDSGRSPPSESSSDSCSTPSHSSSDTHSSLSRLSKDSRSTPSQSSSDSRSTPSNDGAQPRAPAPSHQGVAPAKGGKDAELQERRRDDKSLVTKENLGLKHKQKSTKKHEEGRGDESSSTDAADTTEECRKDKSRQNAGPPSCNPVQDRDTAREESVQPVKPDKRWDKDYRGKGREQRNVEDKGLRRSKYSDSRQYVERRDREKPSSRTGRSDKDRHRNPGGCRAPESRSEKSQKRKADNTERSSVEAQSSTCQKSNISEVPETHKNEHLNPLDRKKSKTEKKNERKTERDVWEGGIKVKAQKRISININLKNDLSYLEKTKEGIKETADGEKLNTGWTEVNEKKERNGDQNDEFKEKTKLDEGEIKETFSLQEQMMEKMSGHKEEDSELGDVVLKGAKEEEKTTKHCEKHEEMPPNTEEEVINGGEEDRRERTDGEMGELVAGTQTERAEEESTSKEKRENPPEELMEDMKLKKEEDTRESFRSDATVDEGRRSCEDQQERKMVEKPLEDSTQPAARDGEAELVLTQSLSQVSPSKWEKEESREEQDGVKVQVQTPSSSLTATVETPTHMGMEGATEQQRHRETERDVQSRPVDRGRDQKRERNSHRSVAPSSGRDRPDNTLSTERGRERRMEMERPRDRERGREAETPRDRPKESKRSKEKERRDVKREERGDGDRGRDRRHSSKTSVQKRSYSSSSHSYSTSHDAEKRDGQQGGDKGSKSSGHPGRKAAGSRGSDSSTAGRAAKLPLDVKTKDRYHSNHQDPPGNHRSHHNQPPAEDSDLSKSRMSSVNDERAQDAETEEWKPKAVAEVAKEGKAGRDGQNVSERKRGVQWEGEGQKVDSSKSSSSSSSSSSSCSELLEEGELKKHKRKKSRKSRDAEEEESRG